MKFIDGVPDLEDLTIEDINQSVTIVADAIRPHWKNEQIQIEERSNGFTNKNYYCHVTGCSDPADAILVRIVSARIPGQLEKAINSMRYLRRVKLGAQLLLTFANGLVMEFIQGEQITWDCLTKVKEPDTWLSYAREMAKFHAATNLDYVKEFHIPNHEDKVQTVHKMVHSSVASGRIPKEALDGLPTPENIYQWGEEIYQQLVDAGAETRFCHLDSNPTNLLIRDDKSVFIVDYDDCYMELSCMEVSSAFDSLCGMEFNLENLPTSEQKEQFLRAYLEARRQLEPERGPVTEKQVRYWKFLLRKTELNGLLHAVGVVLIIQNVSDKPVDLNLAHKLYARYRECRDAVMTETFDE